MKKYFKKTLSFILVLTLVLSLFSGLTFTSSALSSSGKCGTNVTYTFNSSSGLLTINGSGVMTNYSSSNSPFYNQTGIKTIVIENGVTSIGNYAFISCSSLTNITIPNSVISIGDYAFRDCSSLTSVNIPDSVRRIGDEAFRDCIGLTSVTIGDSVYHIGRWAFYNCSGLKELTMPASVNVATWVVDAYDQGYNSVFKNCTNIGLIILSKGTGKMNNYTECTDRNYLSYVLTPWFISRESVKTIVIEAGVRNIGDCAFYGCSGLTSVTIPDSVTSISSSAFYETGIYNNGANWKNGLLYINKWLIEANSSETDTNVKIGDGTIGIADSAFYHCSGLKSITIPDSVKSIGKSAFQDCSSLTNVTLGNSVTSISNSAFYYCSGLKSITIPNSVKSIGESAFQGCSSLTSVTIPDSVTSMGNEAFRGCSGLKSITIPDSVTSIGGSAFYNCTGLTSITIPASVTNIGEGPFTFCNNLISINVSKNNKFYDSTDNCDAIIETKSNTLIQGCKSTIIPDSVTSIGYNAFEGCRGLTSITIPDSVKSIDDSAFKDCSSLTTANIGKSVISIGNNAFDGCYSLKELTIPCSAKIYNSQNTFLGCTNIKKVTLTKGAGTGAIQDYSSSYENTPWYKSRYNLKEIVIEDGISNIGSFEFYNCNGLTSITIPNSVTSIGNCAFSGCDGLTSIIIPDSVTSIGMSAFAYCAGLTSITIPNSITSISNSVFIDCSGLTSITIPDSVTSISAGAFSSCSGLKELIMPCSAKLYNSFGNCTNIEKVTITKGTGTMQNYTSSTGASDTYYQYTPWHISRNNIKELVIEDGVKNIGSYAFYGCSALPSIDIPSSVTRIGNSAFSGCSGLKGINIPDSVINIGDSAFANCTGLTTATIGNLVTNINNTVFSNCNNISSLTIGTGIETIDKTAFTTLNQITLPANLDIDFTCFDNCENIQTINISCGNSKMADWSMNYENSLWYLHRATIKEINLEEGVTEISESAFYDCTNLMKTTVPSTVKRIGSYAYSGCNNLRNITIYSLDCVIPDNPNTIDSFATIYGYDNSTAQAYAQKYNRTFISLGEYVCKEHNYTAKNISAKANAVGYTLHTCSRCGKTFKDNFTNPTGKPAGFKCASRTATAEKFTWTKTAGVSGYQIQISNAKATAWATSKALTANSYTFSKLAAGHAYKARVRFYITKDGTNYFGAWTTITSPTLPAGSAISKLTPAKKAFTAQWKKGACTGYQLQYATNAKFTGAKAVTIKNVKTLKYAVKKLSAKKTYYVRVRTYKTISGKNYYSTWSGAKAVKTK